MLRTLFVKDFAIIDRAEVHFQTGLTALTGETGAGKSLLVDALLLLAGARAEASMVRHGAERAELSAEFDLSALPRVRQWLSDGELDGGDSLVLRRVVRSDGSSRAWLNDAPISIGKLREVSEQLLEIHGQHEHQALLQRNHQRELLDAFGQHGDCCTRVAALARRHAEIGQLLADLDQAARGDPDRLDYLRFQHTELSRLALRPEDFQSLVDQHRRLASAGALIEGAERLQQGLADESAIAPRLHRLISEAQRLLSLDPSLSSVLELLEAASIQLDEAASSLQRYLAHADLDPARYAELDQQLAALHELGRKHRTPPSELGQRVQQLAVEIDQLQHADSRRTGLLTEQAAIAAEYQHVAAELSRRRSETAQVLSQAVTTVLHELAIAGGFAVQIETAADGVRADGRDDIEFLINANPGQPPRPLRKVASGGELARIALAIEVAAIGSDEVPVMVFDEVDSGIGGATAEVVGRKLRQLGQGRAVLCVTHLAQVAAQAHTQIAVSKSHHQGGTRTDFEVVAGKPRIEELARMLGGLQITRETRANAEQMLKKAAQAD
ncbi:MAG: DNA repair protein RecN [Lysobacterales bacterium]